MARFFCTISTTHSEAASQMSELVQLKLNIRARWEVLPPPLRRTGTIPFIEV